MSDSSKIEKWLTGDLSPEERKAFEESEEFKKIERLDTALRAFKSPEYNEVSELERLSSVKIENPFTSIWTRPIVKIAASIILLMGAFFIFRVSNNATGLNEIVEAQKLHHLPDSSEVVLNKGSKIQYVSFDENKREVELEGEAFFEVRKGSTFEVITKSGRIEVLGTAFNVNARSGYFEVNCYHGSVRVSLKDQHKTITIGESVRLKGEDLVRYDVKLESRPSWTQGESSFESVSLSIVLEEFERQHGKKTVVMSSVKNEVLFTGRFTHSDINLALKSITVPFGLVYRLDGDVVYIDRAPPK